MLRVLIVEDDVRVAQVNRGFVERVEGFAVAGSAGTAAAATRALVELQPDLVILDLYLPDGSGLDLLRRLRSGGSTADVIVVTAAKEATALQAALRDGAVDYILKPYRFERFAEALRHYHQYRNQVAATGVVGQEQVDRLLARGPVGQGSGGAAAPLSDRAPKGIDTLTLDLISHALQTSEQPRTAEEFGELLGLSRTTARRYLEYLVETGKARVQAAYGRVGRPERFYLRMM